MRRNLDFKIQEGVFRDFRPLNVAECKNDPQRVSMKFEGGSFEPIKIFPKFFLVTCHNDEKFFENSRRVPKWRIFTELPEMPKWRKIWGFHNDEKNIRHYGRSLNKYSRISRTKLFTDCWSCDFCVENLFSNQKIFWKVNKRQLFTMKDLDIWYIAHIKIWGLFDLISL